MAILELHVSRVAGSAKIAGTLTVTDSLLSWTQNPRKNGEDVEIPYQAITGALQKAKTKPQIRLPVLSGPLVLEFSSMEERDTAIDKLTYLIAASRPSQRLQEPTGSLAAIKKELLQEDQDLNSLYTELVRSGVLSDTDFWKTRRDSLHAKAGISKAGGQVAGISSAMLAQLKPSTSGSNQVTMAITPQFVQQVFAEKPHVHRAFIESVPHIMDAEMFWTRFAKHELALQEGRSSDKKQSLHMPDPLFTKPALSRSDALDTEHVDPTVNLAADMHDGFRRTADSLAEQSQNSTAIAHEMNTHSAVVLKGPAALTHNTGKHASATLYHQQATQYWRHVGANSLEDLRATQTERTEALHIRDPRRYHEQGVSLVQAPKSKNPSSEWQAGSLVHHTVPDSIQRELLGLRVDMPGAEVVLEDMHREGTTLVPEDWVSSGLSATADLLVPEMQTLLRREALLTNELLRHYWACLLMRTSPMREKKTEQLKQALEKQYTKLEYMQEAAQTPDRSMFTLFLRPVRHAIDTAVEAFPKDC